MRDHTSKPGTALGAIAGEAMRARTGQKHAATTAEQPASVPGTSGSSAQTG
jgi:hypothetical protein